MGSEVVPQLVIIERIKPALPLRSLGVIWLILKEVLRT